MLDSCPVLLKVTGLTSAVHLDSVDDRTGNEDSMHYNSEMLSLAVLVTLATRELEEGDPNFAGI